MPEEPSKQSAPYLPFKTFLGALDALSYGVPPIIDRSIWRTQPGGVQGQIMGALRFFNLIDDNNKPTENLRRLIEKPEHRGKAVRALLEWSYADLMKGDLTKMTAKMLEDGMEQYGVSGETKKKAVTFFLQAARYGDLALSPYLQAQIRATPGTRRKRIRRENEVIEASPLPEAQSSGGTTKIITLKSGGRISLTVSIDPFSLVKDDREFVFELIDKLSDYGKSHSIKPEKIEKTA
jgi:hypothetical protein